MIVLELWRTIFGINHDQGRDLSYGLINLGLGINAVPVLLAKFQSAGIKYLKFFHNILRNPGNLVLFPS